MSTWLDTRGRSTLGIAVCGRCGIKMSRDDLLPDPNAPGLMVCRDDLDRLDPWRLAPRQTERLSMDWCRPDLSLSPGPVDVPIASAPPVTSMAQPSTWAASTAYALGAQVSPIDAYGLFGPGQDIYVFLALVPGVSGTSAPAWTTVPGSTVSDGQITWINAGLFLP